MTDLQALTLTFTLAGGILTAALVSLARQRPSAAPKPTDPADTPAALSAAHPLDATPPPGFSRNPARYPS